MHHYTESGLDNERVNAVDRLVHQNIVATKRGHQWSAKAQETRPEELVVA